MKKNMHIVILMILFASGQMLFAQYENPVEKSVGLEKSGQTTMNFLQVGVVPDAVAIGEAYTALGTGVQSMFYNPAGLAEMSRSFEIFASSVQWIADIQYLAGGVAYDTEEYGVIGISFLTVDYGDIIGTRLLTTEEQATNPLGYIETGMVDNVGAYAFGLTYARKITNVFSVGIGVRYAAQQLGSQVLGQYMASGQTRNNEMNKVVFDLGVKYYTPIKSFRFAMSIRNFASSVKYEEISTQLPFTFAVGAAIDLMDFIEPDHDQNNTLLLSSEFSHPNNYTERIHTGIEYTFMGMFSLRGGYVTNHDLNGLSLGVGLKTDIMQATTTSISYSYSTISEYFDDVNRFSVMFSF